MACRIKRSKNGSLSITYKGHFIYPDCVLNHPDYISLSYSAKALLTDVGAQYNGGNNGDLQCSRSVMASRGWVSNATRERALKELIDAGMLVLTKPGGRGIGPNLYAMTWQPIHPCGGKHDFKPTTNAYRKFDEAA